MFLSTKEKDVEDAIKQKFPAGYLIPTSVEDDEKDLEFIVAFDFDGVLADDESEKVFKESEPLEIFHHHEVKNVQRPLGAGLLADFFMKFSFFQKLRKIENISVSLRRRSSRLEIHHHMSELLTPSNPGM